MRRSVAVLFGLVLAFDAAIYGTRILEPYRTANWAYTEGDGRLTLVLPKDVKLDECADAFRLVTLRNNSASARS